MRFENHWFRTGTPTFLLELVKKEGQLKPLIDNIKVQGSAFESFNPDNITAIPLLFQTGYLTIKGIDYIEPGQPIYTLAVPNNEVKKSLNENLLSLYSAQPLENLQSLAYDMQNQMLDLDEDRFTQNLKALLAHIPYSLHINKEAYWHSLFLLWVKMLGFNISGEIMTNNGRIDAVLEQKDYAVIIEIKFSESKALDEMLSSALKQIQEKKYYEAYDGKRIILLAVAFNGKEAVCKIQKIN
jgi:hypothetical protein